MDGILARHGRPWMKWHHRTLIGRGFLFWWIAVGVRDPAKISKKEKGNKKNVPSKENQTIDGASKSDATL